MLRIKNRRLIIGKRVLAPASVTWRVLTDTEQWPKWGPSVAEVFCRRRYIGPGDTGSVKTVIGLRLPFMITSYQQYSFWSWRIGTFEATGHRVERISVSESIVSIDMPWWWAPYLIICVIALRRINRLSIWHKSRGDQT